MTVQILIGDCRAMLATLADDSVHCCVTSPPYYGLRAYGTNAQVWGGDPACSHEWGDEGQKTPWITQHLRAWEGPGHGGGTKEVTPKEQRNGGTGAHCTRCTAWRGELGSEPTPEQYIANLVAVFREIKRVLHPSGTLWCNLGDSYAGSGKGPTGHNGIGDQAGRQGFTSRATRAKGGLQGGTTTVDVSYGGKAASGYKAKDLMGMPWRVAFALQADGWWLRSAIVWAKRAPMPESVTDRPTSSYEMVFLLSKRATYFYDAEAVREESDGASGWATSHANRDTPNGMGNGELAQSTRMGNGIQGRNMRNVWHLGPEPYADAHFATFPTEIPRRAILAGTSARGVCPRCLAPWTRSTERTRTFESGSGRSGNLPAGKNGSHMQGGGETLDIRRGPVVQVATTGWAPGCRCDAGEPIPATVLDPFLGSGTTALVADRLGRDAIGIELNSEYAAMAKRRIAGDSPMFNGLPDGEAAVVQDKQGALGKATYTGFNARWKATQDGMAEVAVRDAEPLTLWGEETA